MVCIFNKTLLDWFKDIQYYIQMNFECLVWSYGKANFLWFLNKIEGILIIPIYMIFIVLFLPIEIVHLYFSQVTI